MSVTAPKACHWVIRLTLRGCTNRPFYHIVVMKNTLGRDRRCKDQIGSVDPLPNRFNERAVAIDLTKLRHWLGKGAKCSTPVEVLLGYAGYFPIHPRTRLQAYRLNKKKNEQKNDSESGSDNQTDGSQKS